MPHMPLGMASFGTSSEIYIDYDLISGSSPQQLSSAHLRATLDKRTMAPDRGGTPPSPSPDDDTADVLHHEPSPALLAARASQPQFTLRALLLGLAIGVLIAFSNTYFGLQTGWISGMAMPSALIGFAYFKGLTTLRHALGERTGSWG